MVGYVVSALDVDAMRKVIFELKDGTGGTLLFDIDTPGSATAMVETYIGDEGIRFQDKVHVSLTNITSISIIYSG